jgi:hypothetical protein
MHSASKIFEGTRAAVGLKSMPLRLANRRPHLPCQPSKNRRNCRVDGWLEQKELDTDDRAGAAGSAGEAGRG